MLPTHLGPPNQTPVARSSYEYSGFTGRFDSNASFGSEGRIVGHSWDFGEGGGGRTTSHWFKNAGAYTVVLTVTNDQGRHRIPAAACKGPLRMSFSSIVVWGSAAGIDSSTKTFTLLMELY